MKKSTKTTKKEQFEVSELLKPEALLNMLEDLDDARKQAKLNEEKFKAISENAYDLVQSVDHDGNILYVNKRWKESLGYSDKEISNLTFMDIIAKEHLDSCMLSFKNLKKGKKLISFQTIFITKNKKKVFVEGNIIPVFKDKKFVSTNGFFRDVTERKKAESRINELAAIVDSSFEGVIVTDKEGIITYVNESWEKITGWRSKDVVGKVTPRILKSGKHPKEFYQKMWKIISSGGVFRGEVINKKKDGSHYVSEAILFPLVLSNGTKRYVELVRDISVRKNAEKKLRENEANYRSIFNSLADSIFIIRMKDYSVVDANVAVLDTLGLDLESFKKKWWKIFTGKKSSLTESVLKSHLRSAASGKEVKFMSECFWTKASCTYEITVRRTIIGGEDRLLLVMRDTSTNHIVERNLNRDNTGLKRKVQKLEKKLINIKNKKSNSKNPIKKGKKK